MNENINYNIRVGVLGNGELVKFQRSIDKVNATARRSEAELKKMSAGMTGLASVAKSLAVTL